MMLSRLFSSSPFWVVIITFLVLNVGFDFNGLYGQDAHEYYRHSRAISQMFDTGAELPPFHWPHAYSALGAILGLIGIPILLGLQLISLISVLLTLYYIRKIIQELYGKEGTWLLLLGAATQVYFIRSGYLVMTDALCCLLLILSVYFLIRFKTQHQVRYFIRLIVFAVGAAFVRYASLPFSVIIIVAGVMHWTSIRSTSKRIVVALGLLTIAIALLLLNNELLERVESILGEWSVENLFALERSNGVRVDANTVPNFMYILSNFGHLGYLSFGVLLLPWLKKWNWKERSLWMAVFLYLLFLGGLATQNQRFLVLGHPIILLLIFPAFELLRTWLSQRKLWWLFVSGTLLFNAAFFYYSFSKLYGMHRMEKEIAASLETLDDEAIIYTFYIDLALGSYNTQNPTVNLWEDKIEFVSGNYVVFNPELFDERWKGTPLLKNWALLKSQYKLIEVRDLPYNWKLYRIQ